MITDGEGTPSMSARVASVALSVHGSQRTSRGARPRGRSSTRNQQQWEVLQNEFVRVTREANVNQFALGTR
jgi:hypothetical protein